MKHDHPAFLPQLIAHRGACGHAPENTLASIRRAIELGAQAVEIDATISHDGQAIVMHDFHLDRCSDGEGPVILKPFSALKKLDAGGWFDEKFKGERIPLLREALDLLASNNVALNLEIKPTLGWEEPTAVAVADVVKAVWPKDARLLVSSMSPVALEVFHDRMPDVALGLIVYAVPENWLAQLNRYHCSSLHCYSDFVSPELVDAVHASDHRLHVFTVNDVAQARALFAMGVDAVFTDFPDRLTLALD